MGRPAKRLLISGYYGFDNSGDEAVLLSILQALQLQEEIPIEPVVLSNDPAATAARYGVESVHRMKPGALWQAVRSCDGLISGGGSLLQDVTGSMTIPYYLGILRLAQQLGKPTFIYSQGIGPVHRRKFYPLIRSVLRKVRYLSVRDEQSAELLVKMGIEREVIDVVPDPVMGLGAEQPDNLAQHRQQMMDSMAPMKPTIGVAVRYWETDRSDLRFIAETLRLVVDKRDAKLLFLPFHEPEDEQASHEVIRWMEEMTNPSAALDTEVVTGLRHPQQMFDRAGTCDVMTGMRLHALIYAASQFVPMAGISYDPKIDHFLNRLHMAPVGTTKSLDPKRASEAILALIDGRESWMKDKEALINDLKRKSQIPAQQIGKFLRING